jgi:uncharacterized surface protein with fasciclin (FAS1) repeats
MQFTLTTLAVVVASCSAFTAPAFSGRASTGLNANIVDTAAGLQGPGVVWGAEGIAVGKEEADLKGYDNFGKFIAAVEAAGLSDVLKTGGPYTVFAPVDSAFDAYKGPITAEVLKYHVVEGERASSSITANLPTLAGKDLVYGRRFRKNFLNDAIIGQGSFGGFGDYPTDVKCDNGVIHAISVVLEEP